MLNGNTTKIDSVFESIPKFVIMNTLILSLCHLLRFSDINDGFNLGNLHSRRLLGRSIEYPSSNAVRGLHLILKLHSTSCIIVARCLQSIKVVLQ